MRIRVVSWNIHKGIGGVDRRYQPDRIVAVLTHHEPDVLLLQEVEEGAARSGFDRQVDVIGDALGLPHRVYVATHRLRRQPGHYGNAIICRWPLGEVANVDLTIKPKKRRGALVARSRVRVGKVTRSVALFNLHLGLAGFERGIQLKRFFESHPVARLHHRTPTVLGGDFNDLWGTLGPTVLEPAGFKRAGRRVNTYPAVYPLRPLDGIFLRGDIRSKRCSVSRLEIAEEASDHLPLVADLELRRKRSGGRRVKKRSG